MSTDILQNEATGSTQFHSSKRPRTEGDELTPEMASVPSIQDVQQLIRASGLITLPPPCPGEVGHSANLGTRRHSLPLLPSGFNLCVDLVFTRPTCFPCSSSQSPPYILSPIIQPFKDRNRNSCLTYRFLFLMCEIPKAC